MRIFPLWLGLILALSLFLDSLSYAAELPPLTLPGPSKVTFKFRPIKVKGGSDPLGGQKFTMGDPTGNFRTPPTAVVLGGSFIHEQERYFYMSECEITEEQYRAVMGEEAASRPANIKGDFPVTKISYFEALRFTDKLNQWLYQNALRQLPCAGEFPGFVRLPTEEEWEFAARGGCKVDDLTFDASTPYGEDDLAAYEWFAGPDSSHNKVQRVGRLKPNPLGLYDMLGNVQEMTISLYRIEYYQGRNGGFAARGGHFLTNEEDMIAAKRSEEPLYLGSITKGMQPNKKATLGFRLVLAAPILTDRQAIAEMDQAWKKHRSGTGSTLPAAVSVAN
ncbi:MAG: SUMF1/EgtB/PvdO family nonheme iron enzyme, partial [Desulfovibrionaceae bacterium]|nr:SUMF1/EgtB/PvdO family nonheme iron enzyme [Desulfovibrionaceae bacterium]